MIAIPRNLMYVVSVVIFLIAPTLGYCHHTCVQLPMALLKRIVVCLLAANSSLTLYLLVRPGARDDTRVLFRRLPSLAGTTTDSGAVIRDQTFLNRPVYVEIVNPYVQAETDMLIRLLSSQFRRPINWVLITTDPQRLRTALKDVVSDDLTIISDRDSAVRRKFRTYFPGQWIVYDEAGLLRAEGSYDDADAAAALRSVANEQPWLSATLMRDWFQQQLDSGALRKIPQKRPTSPHTVLVLLSAVTTGCPIEEELALLSQLSHERPDISIIGITPAAFGESAAKVLALNADLRFPVIAAPRVFGNAWSELTDRYGGRSMNGAVALITGTTVAGAGVSFEEVRAIIRTVNTDRDTRR